MRNSLWLLLLCCSCYFWPTSTLPEIKSKLMSAAALLELLVNLIGFWWGGVGCNTPTHVVNERVEVMQLSFDLIWHAVCSRVNKHRCGVMTAVTLGNECLRKVAREEKLITTKQILVRALLPTAGQNSQSLSWKRRLAILRSMEIFSEL